MRECVGEKVKQLIEANPTPGKPINLHVWYPSGGGTMLQWEPFPVDDPTLGIFGGVGWFPLMDRNSVKLKEVIQRAIAAAEKRGWAANVVHGRPAGVQDD
jgi:hypothetical protein